MSPPAPRWPSSAWSSRPARHVLLSAVKSISSSHPRTGYHLSHHLLGDLMTMRSRCECRAARGPPGSLGLNTVNPVGLGQLGRHCPDDMFPHKHGRATLSGVMNRTDSRYGRVLPRQRGPERRPRVNRDVRARLLEPLNASGSAGHIFSHHIRSAIPGSSTRNLSLCRIGRYAGGDRGKAPRSVMNALRPL